MDNFDDFEDWVNLDYIIWMNSDFFHLSEYNRITRGRVPVGRAAPAFQRLRLLREPRSSQVWREGTGHLRTVSPNFGALPERLTARVVPSGVLNGVRSGGWPADVHGVWRGTAFASPRPYQEPRFGHPSQLLDVQFRGEALHPSILDSDSRWDSKISPPTKSFFFPESQFYVKWTGIQN